MGTPASTRQFAGGFFLFLSLAAIHMTLLSVLPCHAKPDESLCIPSEREALLRFKRDLTDPSNRLSSWAEEDSHTDCCHWSGVVCDNSTGHVLQLRLACIPPSPYSLCDEKVVLGGKLSPSLLNLKHLTHLDLSFNHFGWVPIPTFLGSLENLRYLNLSHGEFGGTIPRQLGNLSKLESLDLRDYGYGLGSSGSSLEWASRLWSLQFLDLSRVNLSAAHDWVQVTSRLPSLQQLHLSDCDIPTSVPAAVNFSSLWVLDLSGNSFSWVPGWIFTLPALTSLSLSSNNLQGPIPVGLRNLTSLTGLDLSSNLLDSSIPNGLFDDKLEELNLRWNSLQGRIPKGIGNMTSLATLDLSGNTELEGGGWLFKSLGNLCRLTTVALYDLKFGGNTSIDDVKSLRGCNPHGLNVLDLGGTQLWGQFSDLVHHFSQFKNLASLHLWNNSLQGPIPESIGRLSSLESLDLESNQLAGPIPESIGSLSSLKCLDLSNNQLAGLIPESIGSLSSLKSLNLESNQLAGPIPESIGSLSSLKNLHLSSNQLNGSLPKSLGQLINLDWLDTSYNPLTGDISEIHFANLTRLMYLRALENSFSLKVRPNWVPPFQLHSLYLDSWQIGPQFPQWLRSQTYLNNLKMSRSEIASTIPNWFWNSFPQMVYLNLSQSQIHGNLSPSSVILPHAAVIDLSSNQFSGVLPIISPFLRLLNLSNNNFSGSISPFLCHEPQKLKQLQYLNFQHNHLSGEFPDCWTNWTHLTVIRLGNNNLTGNIPRSIGFLHELQSLHLESNQLGGEIPTSMGNCKQLISIDLGENNFVGSWIGKHLGLLKLLKLRSNKFYGKIPNQICTLMSLQVLDLAHNNFHGSIPACFNNFTAMTTIQKNRSIPIFAYSTNLTEDVSLVWKGNTFDSKQNLGLMISMDLSSNHLSGEIPEDLMTLVGMRSLNLSNNFFTGEIPKTIGGMQVLESIDFSHNQISGEIPSTMSALTFLCYLDISYNKLVGQIPSSTQLQSFNPSSYVGNKLCGPPISDNCSTMIKVKSEQTNEEDEVEVYVIYGSMTMGFIIGFWIIWGPLLLVKSWRLIYFKSLENLCQKINVAGNTYS